MSLQPYQQFFHKHLSFVSESANNFSKSPSGMAGIIAIVFLIILLIIAAVKVINGSEATYMNNNSLQQQIVALNYVSITYDSSGNIIVVDPSGNGSNGSYSINDYYIYSSYNSCNI